MEPEILNFTGPYDSERPYKPFDIVNDPDKLINDPTALKYAVLPEIIDITPIQEIVANGVDPLEPSEWSPDEPYGIGEIVEFTPIDDATPDRIPDYFGDPEAVVVVPTIEPELYVAIAPVEPAAVGPNGLPGTVGPGGSGNFNTGPDGIPLDRNTNSPKNNPDKWAKLVPELGPPGTVYPKNAIIPVRVKPSNQPDNKKLFIALEPTSQVPKLNPNTGTNLRPAVS